jgi:hypothetical protein
MAQAPGRGVAGHPLASALGAQRSAALGAELILRAVRWATSVAPGAVHGAFAPAEARGEMEELLGGQVRLFAQTGGNASEALADASARLFAAPGEGPLLIAWSDLPRWRPDHAAGALEDLAHGFDVSVGPVFDGGFYLVALARPLPDLFAAPDADWLGPNAMASAFSAAHEAGLGVGMLRAERGLRGPDDVRAVLVDPLTDPELRALLADN